MITPSANLVYAAVPRDRFNFTLSYSLLRVKCPV